MRFITPVKIVMIVVVLILTLIPANSAVQPAHAASAAFGGFMADCGSFSVNVAVSGYKDDGGGMDFVRYQVSDGVDRVLFQEDDGIRIGTTVGSTAIDLFYQNGMVPARNPVWFSVIDLDAAGNKQLFRIPFQVNCQPQSGPGGSIGFQPPNAAGGTMLHDQQLYQWPGSDPINFWVRAGEGKNVLYRTPDGSWVAVWVGGQELVWIPTSSIAVNVWQANIPPTHLQGSGLTPGMNEANHVAGVPSLLGPAGGGFQVSASSSASSAGGITTWGNVNMRATPLSSADVVDTVKKNTPISVLGRNSTGNWLKITYNGKQGWVTTYYVNMSAADVRNLPVVS